MGDFVHLSVTDETANSRNNCIFLILSLFMSTSVLSQRGGTSWDSPFPQPFFSNPLSDFDRSPQNTTCLLSYHEGIVIECQHNFCEYNHKCGGRRPRRPSAGLKLKAKVGKKERNKGKESAEGKPHGGGGEMPTFTAVFLCSPLR